MNRLPTDAKKSYQLIIFDWDGTVLDSIPNLIHCYRQAFEILGQPLPDPEVLRRVAGRGWELALPALLPGTDDVLCQDLSAIYHQVWRRRGLPEPGLVEGAEALLQDLRQRGYLLAVATSRSRDSIERNSAAYGLRQYFHALCGFDDSRPKPDPAMLHAILEELSVPAGQALMVGDSDIDIEMAHRAGVDACGVTSGGVSREELLEMGADFVVADITGLQAFLPGQPEAGERDARTTPMSVSGDDLVVQMTDREGTTWVRKKADDASRLLLEYAILHGYRALGLPSSECRLAHQVSFSDGRLCAEAGSYLFFRAVPLVEMQEVLRDATNDLQAEIKQKAARGFAADCLFGNQAVFASPLVSLKVDGQGEVWRTAVDTTLSLAEVGDTDFIDTARNGDSWPQAAYFFGGIHKRDLIAQIDHIEAQRSRLVPEVDPVHGDLAERIRALMDRRVDMLLGYRNRLLEERSAFQKNVERSLRNPQRTAVFDKEFDATTLNLNGIPFGGESPTMPRPVSVEEPPYHLERGYQPAAGIVVVEPDGRVWIYEPRDHYGGHQNAFPKGRVEGTSHDLDDLHATAVRETWEEIGIHGRITAYLGDLSFFNHQTRYYLGERIGGDPCQAHWEAARVKLVPLTELHRLVNIENDRTLMRMLLRRFGLPLHRPEVVTILGAPQAHRWGGIQGRLTTVDREAAGASGGRWFEDEAGVHWFMKGDRFVQGLQTSAEVVAARVYDFFGYRVPETQKMVVGDTHLVFSRDVGPVRDITDFFGLDEPNIRCLRVIAAYLSDWGRISNAMDNLVTEDGTLVLIDFGASLGARGWGRVKPGPPFAPTVGYFPATRDFWVLYDEYRVGMESSHPWQCLTVDDVMPLIARFEALHDDVIDDIVAAAQYPTEADTAHLARALKWRRDAVIAGAYAYFSGQSARLGRTAERRRRIASVRDRAVYPSLGRIAEALVEDRGSICFDAAIDTMGFRFEGGTIPVASFLDYMQHELAETETAEQIIISEQAMRRHWRSFFTADPDARYLINVSGLYETQGKGNRTDLGVPGDAMSLRQYTSVLFYPMNALFRMDLNDAESVSAFRGMYQVAARNFTRVIGTRWRLPLGQNMIRLYDFAASIHGRSDDKLCRLVGEQILHNLMATRALLRQAPLDPALHPRLYRIADLDENALAKYRSACAEPPGSPGSVITEFAFTSTSVDPSRSDLYSRRDKTYRFIIAPLPEGTRGRYLNGEVDNVVSTELEVLYPPGSQFRVARIEEDVTGDTTRGGELRTHLFLEETAVATAPR